MKKEMWKTQLPTWAEQVTTIGKVPFLFLALKDLDNNDLHEIALHLNNKQPGFYFLISDLGEKSLFVAQTDPKFLKVVNMKNFGSWLKDEHGLRGGGKIDSLQGGGGKFDTKLAKSIAGWIKENQ